MDKDNRIQAAWRWPALLGLNLLAAAVLASWLLPATRALWDGADLWLFQSLNGSLGHSALWDGFWAVTSTRLSDALVGVLMLALMLHSRWVFRAGELRPALFTFLGLLLMLLVIRVLFNKLVGVLDWQHASPSTLVAGTYHLSGAFPELERLFELKDRSSRSFPGDHASVLLLWGLFMAQFSRGWKLAASLALVVLFMLPRLVAGAHWLVDVAVGGLFIALVSYAWGYCTPLAGHIARGLAWLCQPLWTLLQRLPLINRLLVVNPQRAA
ncbi:phosphatase PAP2 family protein [Pseudomonas benzenivorans]|uniref:Phosphatase PAP2 family protein n=1 Tax=Pseudomonas benzenivorans TaxID=556533 RepID=A0ABY5HBV4_9PSED|nr:phosphatase PAP2 family protein [Pseudomonas benzenivorans]UTW09683.1 phosphatase PAP2 family protein [Pseudomonas benzenivorans]